MNKYRANRSNYVAAYIFIFLLGVAEALLIILSQYAISDQSGIGILVGLFVILSSVYLFLIWARMVILRSRDFNFPGWAGFLLAFFFTPVALVFAFIPGTEGKNKYGPQPSQDISLKSILLK